MKLKLVSAAALTLVVIASSPDVRADAVTDWNEIASTTIVRNAGQPPPVAALSFAMVQGAVYDAVNAIDRGYQPYLVQPNANPTDSPTAAAATAAFHILKELFPAQLATLQGQYDNYIAGVLDEPAGSKAAGIAIGRAAAEAMSAARQNDGRLGPGPALSAPAPGIWRPTAPNFASDPSPWVGNVRPFLVPSAEMLRTDGPNELTSAAYAKDLNELKELGSLTSTKRTADQTDAAIFWQEHLHGFLNRVIRNLAQTRGLNIAQSARLFAMTNMAAADAAIGCWNDKYYWQFWRPITAIREANTDGNHATQADATWAPLFDPATPAFTPPSLVTPPFPDHPSGHTCGTAAFMRTLRNFFGSDKIAFTVISNKSGTTRSFDRFSIALKEVIDARVWAGIHFRTSDTQGAVLGDKVARYLKKHYFERAQ
ncbi:MAG TPA: vanadium-dependent haloperoxidase [Chthoniobacteraceae bacterium]|nr:vanadium-dependent haloperoxidase [Chthoniobacteraceae bacterium]